MIFLRRRNLNDLKRMLCVLNDDLKMLVFEIIVCILMLWCVMWW